VKNVAPTITRLEPLRPRGLRVLLHFDQGDPLEVTLEALELMRLAPGDTLDAARRRSLLEADADVRVREAALAMLASRARTRRDLGRRLRRKGFAAARVDACLERLEQKGLLDDRAVAEAFVRDRLHHRPRGRNRLASELRAQGVESEVAHAAVERVFEDEDVSDERLAKESAEAWLERQGAGVVAALAAAGRTPERERARRRLLGYLARRGFAGDALQSATRHVERLALERGRAGAVARGGASGRRSGPRGLAPPEIDAARHLPDIDGRDTPERP
jgi:regulatory protein